jgi:hypothetical protein
MLAEIFMMRLEANGAVVATDGAGKQLSVRAVLPSRAKKSREAEPGPCACFAVIGEKLHQFWGPAIMPGNDQYRPA